MNRTLQRKIITCFLMLAAWCMHTHSAESPSHPYDYIITVDHSHQNHFPITALSNQGALEFAKGYAAPQTSDANTIDSSSAFYKNIQTSPLNFESHTNTINISGSTDPLSIIYLVRDSPKILTGLFHSIFDTTGKQRRQKEAQVDDLVALLNGEKNVVRAILE